MLSPATLFLTIDGTQETLLHFPITILRPPSLTSMHPNWMAVPSPGAIIELSGSRLHQVDFVFVHRAEQETLQLNAFNISEESISFEWPQVTQTACLSVLGSNKVPMLIGNGQ